MSPKAPELDSLTRELAAVVSDGGLRPAVLEDCSQLLELDCVREQATGDEVAERAIAGEEIVKRALVLLGPGPRSDCAQVLFGVAPGTKGVPTAARRRQAAELWGGVEQYGVSVAHFRKHLEAPLIRDLAYELLKLDHLTSIQAQAAQNERTPSEAKGEIEGMPSWRHRMMIERQPTYCRICNALTDLQEYRTAWRQAGADEEREDYIHASLHAYVRFMIAVRELNDQWGGQWLLPKTEEEVAAARKVQEVLANSPYGLIEESELRTMLDVLTHQEIAPWIAFLKADEHGEELLDKWRQQAKQA